MTTKTQRVYSDLAIPPGETLAEELEVRGMTQEELATRLGCPAQVVNEMDCCVIPAHLTDCVP